MQSELLCSSIGEDQIQYTPFKLKNKSTLVLLLRLKNNPDTSSLSKLIKKVLFARLLDKPYLLLA